MDKARRFRKWFMEWRKGRERVALSSVKWPMPPFKMPTPERLKRLADDLVWLREQIKDRPLSDHFGGNYGCVTAVEWYVRGMLEEKEP